MFLRARYYSPEIGRFISREPILSPMVTPHQMFILIENSICNSPNCSSSKVTILREPVWLVPFLIYNPQILNPYVYCYNNPVNWIDNNGLIAWGWKAWTGMILGLLGGTVLLTTTAPVWIPVSLILGGAGLIMWDITDAGKLIDRLSDWWREAIAGPIERECP